MITTTITGGGATTIITITVGGITTIITITVGGITTTTDRAICSSVGPAAANRRRPGFGARSGVPRGPSGMTGMLPCLLRQHQDADNDKGRNDRRGRRPAQGKPAVADWLVEEIADRRAKRP